MQATFHWLRIETFIYATEKEDLVRETFANLVGTDEFDTEVSEGEHGNRMLILQRMATGFFSPNFEKEWTRLFGEQPAPTPH